MVMVTTQNYVNDLLQSKNIPIVIGSHSFMETVTASLCFRNSDSKHINPNEHVKLQIHVSSVSHLALSAPTPTEARPKGASVISNGDGSRLLGMTNMSQNHGDENDVVDDCSQEFSPQPNEQCSGKTVALPNDPEGEWVGSIPTSYAPTHSP